MISITCSNCKTDLSIDDAFAGGVCRCQHCGTIQTVPSASRRPASAPQPVAKPAPKVLHQARARGSGTPGTGLDELADAVASSGLGGSGLASGRHARPAPRTTTTAEPASDRRNAVPIVPIVGGAVVVLIAIIIALVWIFTHGNGAPHATSGGGSSGGDTISGPTFCGASIDASSVVFLLDRGDSIADQFDALKASAYTALEQLGPDRQFQIIMWDNDSGSTEFPQGSLHKATAGEIDNCRADFQDLVAKGETHLSGPMKEALERHPQLIVVATAKPDLDEDDSAALRSAAGKGVKVNAVQIASQSQAPNPVLKEVAQATGGSFTKITPLELRGFSQ